MYKINPLLLELRLSYFREEFDSKSEKDYDKKHMHDMLDHKVTLLPENNKIVIDLKNLIKKTFKEDDRISVQRVFKRDGGCGDHIVEFAYGLNGGTPKDVINGSKVSEEELFDQKWIHYVKQISYIMQTMYNHGYNRPSLVWIEDPSHSDCYSCYISFYDKK